MGRSAARKKLDRAQRRLAQLQDWGRCLWCSERLVKQADGSPGRPRVYCSDAHRLAHWRAKRRKGAKRCPTCGGVMALDASGRSAHMVIDAQGDAQEVRHVKRPRPAPIKQPNRAARRHAPRPVARVMGPSESEKAAVREELYEVGWEGVDDQDEDGKTGVWLALDDPPRPPL